MSAKNITTFLHKAQTDPALAEKIVLATAEATAAVAQQEGLPFSAAEMLHFQANVINDEELESVSGGGALHPKLDPNLTEEQKQQRREAFLNAGLDILQTFSGIGQIIKRL